MTTDSVFCQPFLLRHVFSFLPRLAVPAPPNYYRDKSGATKWTVWECMTVCKAWHAAMPERYIVIIGVFELRNLVHHHRTLSEAFPGGIDTLVLFELTTHLGFDEAKPKVIKRSPIYAKLCAPLIGIVPQRVKLTTTTVEPILSILAPLNLMDLRGLDLSRCRGLTDSDVLAICSACTNLEVVSVSWCTKVHATGAAALLRLPKLRSLDLSWIDVSGLAPESVSCSTLRTLTVIDCAGLPTQPSWLSALRNLEAIEMWPGSTWPGSIYSSCQWKCVGSVLAGLPNLRSAVLYDWDVSSLLLACAAPMLEVLHVANFEPRLTAENIAQILDIGAHIRFLCLTRRIMADSDVSSRDLILASELVSSPRAQRTEIMIPATQHNVTQCGLSIDDDDCSEPVDLVPGYRVGLSNNIYIHFATKRELRGPCPLHTDAADPLLDPIFPSVVDHPYTYVVGTSPEQRRHARRKRKRSRTSLDSVPKRKRTRIVHK